MDTCANCGQPVSHYTQHHVRGMDFDGYYCAKRVPAVTCNVCGGTGYVPPSSILLLSCPNKCVLRVACG